MEKKQLLLLRGGGELQEEPALWMSACLPAFPTLIAGKLPNTIKALTDNHWRSGVQSE